MPFFLICMALLLACPVFSQVHQNLPYRLIQKGKADESKQALPLIVFLHGAGERGDENERQLIHAATWQDQLPEACYILAPQCPKGQRWAETHWGNRRHRHDTLAVSKPMNDLISLLDSLRQRPEIDTQRIYLLGLSMGGYGTWDLALRQPQWFAALAPICGGSDPLQACRLKNTPIWIFHGALDRVVPVSRSRDMVQALKKCGIGSKLKYSEYPKIAHGAWVPAFAEPQLFPWLFAQKKNGS